MLFGLLDGRTAGISGRVSLGHFDTGSRRVSSALFIRGPPNTSSRGSSVSKVLGSASFSLLLSYLAEAVEQAEPEEGDMSTMERTGRAELAEGGGPVIV